MCQHSHDTCRLPTSLEVRLSDFNNTLWQRIRKLWLLPSLTPASNSLRCSRVSVGVFTRPIMGHKDKNNLNYLLMYTYANIYSEKEKE